MNLDVFLRSKSISDRIDAHFHERRNRVHVQIGHIAECQTTADVTTCKHKRDWRVRALTPFGNESFAGLE
jgi:hypothetical protein